VTAVAEHGSQQVDEQDLVVAEQDSQWLSDTVTFDLAHRTTPESCAATARRRLSAQSKQARHEVDRSLLIVLITPMSAGNKDPDGPHSERL